MCTSSYNRFCFSPVRKDKNCEATHAELKPNGDWRQNLQSDSTEITCNINLAQKSSLCDGTTMRRVRCQVKLCPNFCSFLCNLTITDGLQPQKYKKPHVLWDHAVFFPQIPQMVSLNHLVYMDVWF